MSALLELGEGPEDRIDVANIGDPRGIDSNRQPGRAGNDSKKDKRIQSVREGQARDGSRQLRFDLAGWVGGVAGDSCDVSAAGSVGEF